MNDADPWAFGVILFELLVGEYPFKAASDIEIKERIMSYDWSFPSEVDSCPLKISNEARDLIGKILNKVRKYRPTLL